MFHPDDPRPWTFSEGLAFCIVAAFCLGFVCRIAAEGLRGLLP